MIRTTVAAAALAALACVWSVPAAHADEIVVNGHARTYEMYVPAGIEAGAPLVLAFHGQGGSGQVQAALSDVATFYACARPERVAAIAPVAASLAKLQALGCSFAPPLRIQMIAGNEDPLVPWDGSGVWLSVPDSIGFWVKHNQVSAEPTVDEWLPDTAPGDWTLDVFRAVNSQFACRMT